MAPCNSKLLEVLPPHYGCVIMTGIGSLFVNGYLSHKVMKARKAYDIPYPDLYSKDSKEFNCIQRSHQNFLEGYPGFLMCLFLSGLQYPRMSALGGVIYLAGRVVYAKGYSSGDPEKRKHGAFGYVGLIMLIGGVVSLAFHLCPVYKQGRICYWKDCC